MRKIRLGVAAFVIATAAALIPSTPASAHTNAGVCAFVGSAQTPGGLWFPGLDPDGVLPFSSWSFSSDTLDVCATAATGVTLLTHTVSGSGGLNGHCGGSLGTGTVNFAGDSSAATFVTVGGTGVLAGTGPAAVASVFQARPLPAATGQVPCLTHPANSFLIVGVGAGAHV